MRYTVTERTEKLVADLASLAAAADNRLNLASAAAQKEWEAVRFQWPSEVDLRTGAVALSDEELERMRAKVMRFVRILESAGSAALLER